MQESLRSEDLTELDPSHSVAAWNKAGITQYSVTLRRGRQLPALFYIIHMKNTISTYILFIGFP